MQPVEAVRRFNRFYTRRIGVLRGGLAGTPYSLPEARLLYELAQAEPATATALGAALDLDLGYLSRLLQGVRRQGLVRARPAPRDARQSLLSLTAKGRRAFAALDSRSRGEMSAMLSPLPRSHRERLVEAMQTIESVLEKKPTQSKIVLRAHRPGDMGWVVHRHGALYAQEYGWDERFEALVAGVAKNFIDHFDPARERCWIAELNGEPAGSILLVKKTKTTAKLRLLLVEPRARGLGLGARLVAECIAFAREKGYHRLVLWTQSNLDAARAIYRKQGFKLAKSEPHASFGYDLVGEYWELKLT
jgi:DNA-binding MarR family transcriptional regulator/GNAT superfamily N-acetyltransferase